jgi:catalase (peroxidase I)
METAIISIICIALVIFGGMTMANGFMTSVDASTMGLEEVGSRDDTIMRTELTPVSTSLSQAPDPDELQIVLENTGQTKMADFDKWDVIIQYYDETDVYHVEWLLHEEPAGNYQWEVGWIRMNGQAEVFEPDVLNPGEQIMLKALLDPEVGADTTNLVTVSTPTGVTCSTYFTP